MPMHATTVRFTEDLWQLLEREAATQGTSAAQLIRDATILRLAHLAGHRGDPETVTSIEDLASRANRRRQALAPPALADAGRLATLHRTRLLDEPPDPALDRLARLAQRLLRAPVALVTLIDRDRQFFTSAVGLSEPLASARQTSLEYSFCQHALVDRRPLVVGDAREHPTLRRNPAIEEHRVIAYVGMPLLLDDDHAIGALCVIDHEPRLWTAEEVGTLSDLAASAVTELRLRLGGAETGGDASWSARAADG